MKKFKTLTLGVILLCMISISTITVSAEGTDYTQKFGWTQMTTPEMQEAYKIVYNSIKNFEFKILIPKELGLSHEQLQIITSNIENDYPEAFYISPVSFITEQEDGFLIKLGCLYNGASYILNDGSSYYTEVVNATKSAIAVFNTKVNEIVANAPKTSDHKELSLYTFNYLKNNVEYLLAGGYENNQTAYSALIDGKCVCAGFAKAYAVIMDRLGVKTWYITGDANNGKIIALHAWNVSWYDGVCVYTDPTWNSTYNYLNISGSQMSKDHFADEKFARVLGTCNHNQFAYVAPVIEATGIQLNASSCALTTEGQTHQINATVIPENANNKSVSFSSSNPSVATVSETGVVTAVGEGTTVITVRSGDGAASAEVTVTVDFPEHKHEVMKVNSTAPTCEENGIAEHYKCNCGALFLDAQTTKVATDTDLIIYATGHKGKIERNDNEHWQACEICKKELSEKEKHQRNEGTACGACGYTFEATKPTTEPPEAQTEPTDTSGAEHETQPGNTESSQKPSEGTGANETQNGADGKEDQNGHKEPTTDLTEDTGPQEDDLQLHIPLVFVVLIICIVAGVVTGVVLARKKKD